MFSTIPLEREPRQFGLSAEGKPTLSGVVSLLDMLKVNAADFAAMVGDLEVTGMRANIRAEGRPPLLGSQVSAPLLVDGVVPDKEKKEFMDVLRNVIERCEAMNLVHTHDAVSYAVTIHEQYKTKWSDVRNDVHNILVSLYSELRREIFLQLDSSQVELFSSKEDKKHFGDAVATAFPSAAIDIHEAGNCLALERWPACVFHCMRVLEIGLAALATTFGVTSINWHNVIEECEAKIRKIDSTWGADWKDQQKFYSEAARHFMFVKDALRNHIMHVRDVFDEGKALSVWQHTKEFMQQISKRLHE